MEPIDMVYCWCDGNDPAFKARKNKYLQLEKIPHDEDSVGELRFVDNEELRYSLRSLEMYAPWINHVYIVTDRQVPKWLNTDYEKVSVVDHSKIMPKELIPCFTSNIIERYLVNIPGLSEHFLYGNDDMFFGRPLTPNFFFVKAGRPRVYVKYYEKFKEIRDEQDFQHKYEQVATWMKSNLNAWNLLYDKYGRHEFYTLAHTIDGYTKSLFLITLKRYQEAFQKTKNTRFRNETNISRALFGLDAVYHGDADLELIKTPSFWQKHIHRSKGYSWKCYTGAEDAKTRQQILRFEPYVFCVNAGKGSNVEEKIAMKQFYEQLFPRKSAFEL